MGLIKDWIQEMGSTWSGMAQGDPMSFLGIPSTTPKGTGYSNTGHQGGQPGTGQPNTGHPGGSPNTGHPGNFTPQQKKMLLKLFEQQYGRLPLTEFELEQWLAVNW